jgi:hypothetical protein
MIRRLFAPLLAVCVLSTSAFAADVDYKGNLDKIPATDPAASAVPALLPDVKGKHPRLLFSENEIPALKEKIANDPVLKKTYADVSTWSKRFTFAKAWQPREVVKSDTPAIVQVKSWPGLAYTYAIDKDPVVKQAIIDILQMFLEEPYWADNAELDSNMGAGNNMLTVGILFDAVHDDLEPEFRKKMADKILVHVRRMHYLGYKQLSLMPIKYWQQDPQNNHRWHRNAGMAACLLAIADVEGINAGYQLQELKKEFDFVTKWFPHDGDCHEGAGYQVFGFSYLALGCTMMDRALGTTYLKTPGLKNAWAQQLYYAAPGRSGNISFGDDMNGTGVFDNQEAAFFLSPSLSRDKNVQAALLRRMEQKMKMPQGRTFSYPWLMLTFYDPTVGLGDYKGVPTSRLFADLGAASMRNSWEDDAFALTFKCGPYGGYRLNEYAHATKDDKGKPHYVNVAHDDPDANSFALGSAGDFFFHPGFYATNKVTEKLNTITVDGKGQIGEGEAYTQPVPDKDMRTLSYLTTYKADDRGRVVIEGEAGKTYEGLTSFRRTAIYMPGEYILLLDNIKADKNRKITWRGTVPKAHFADPATGKCFITTKANQRLDFQILSTKPFTGAIDFVYVDGRFANALLHQFQFTADTDTVQFAALMDPWKKNLALTLNEKDGTTTLTVKGENINDTWTWTPAKDLETPSQFNATRAGAPLLTITEKDKAPHGD